MNTWTQLRLDLQSNKALSGWYHILETARGSCWKTAGSSSRNQLSPSLFQQKQTSTEAHCSQAVEKQTNQRGSRNPWCVHCTEDVRTVSVWKGLRHKLNNNRGVNQCIIGCFFLNIFRINFILYVYHVPAVSFMPFPLKSYLWYHFIKYRIVSSWNVIFWENDTVLEDFYLEKFQKIERNTAKL